MDKHDTDDDLGACTVGRYSPERVHKLEAHNGRLEARVQELEERPRIDMPLRTYCAQLEVRVQELEKERKQIASEFANSPGGMSVERQMQWCTALQEETVLHGSCPQCGSTNYDSHDDNEPVECRDCGYWYMHQMNCPKYRAALQEGGDG